MGSKSGNSGIGMLIILISLLLVAAIAGYVLIFSQTELHEDALSTSEGAKRQVTTQLELVDLSAEDGLDGAVDNFKYVAKLKPGADSINLRDVVIYVNTYNDTLRLIYRPGRCTRDGTTGFYTIR